MAPTKSYPSIQSFYKREVPVSVEPQEAVPGDSIGQGDGFTEEELAAALDPLNRKWNPEREYEQSGIGELVPGPKTITFVGRIVNLSTHLGSSQKKQKAAGWHYLILKDDSAALSVKLYFPQKEYPLKLGQLLTIWTVFISDPSKAGTIAIPSVSVHANLFPGRVTSDHIMIHTNKSTNGICRTPLNYERGKPLQGLMALDSYLASGHDGVVGAKILVCVKSIGARKKITTRNGGERDLADVLLFDHTSEVRLTLWGSIIDSAKEWQAGKTMLLLSNPGYKVEYSGRGSIVVQHSTMIDIDPDFPDAHWLKKYAVGLTKKECLCLEFPENVWDVEAAEYGVYRILFTLAEIDEWVRNDPRQTFTGHINVTIMEMSLVLYYRRNMLMCTECCGVPIYANAITTACRNCSKDVNLSLNPKIIGKLLDETGCLAAGKLLWSERAWEQLLGRKIKEVVEMTSEEIRWLEQRVSFLRMHLVFGWQESVGRLAILGARM